MTVIPAFNMFHSESTKLIACAALAALLGEMVRLFAKTLDGGSFSVVGFKHGQ
jgi:hypothetical protein